MSPSGAYLNPGEAARKLGVSAKALRLYERRGLIAPARTAAGWRAYGPQAMARAGQVVALRALGLSLAQVGKVLAGEAAGTLAAHQARLEGEVRRLAGTVAKVRDLRGDLAPAPAAPCVSFDLPWPWGGERFELQEIAPITYITGPLGSGKSRLAERLADSLPGADFLGLDRRQGGNALIDALEAQGPAAVVVDLVEHGLDAPAQEALIARLRRRGPGARPLFLLTRSSAILDLGKVGPGEAIVYCPANHSPPIHVAPYPGAPGYEAVATCLATPDVRARTAGVIAVRARAAG